MENKPGNGEYIRKMNQHLIIDTVIQKGLISRADLSKLLKLSPPSVSKNIDQLVARGILVEVGEGFSNGGRKPMLLDFNSAYTYMVAIDFCSQNVKVALGDMKRKCIGMLSVVRKKKKINPELIESVIGLVYQLLEQYNVKKQDVAVIIVGIPGIIDEEKNEIQTADWFEDLGNKRINDILGQEFDARVILKNDIKLAAIAEAQFGVGRTCDNLVMINVDMGVGAGIIINGNVYTGKNYAAGEVGFCVTNISDIDKNADKLESFISIPAIMEKLNERLKSESSIVSQYCKGNTDAINFDMFVKGVLVDDPCCKAIADDVIRYLAWLIINLVCLLDIHFFVIDGLISELGAYLEERLTGIVQKIFPETLPGSIKLLDIRCSELGEKAGIYGAFVVGREHILNHILD